MSNIKEKKLNKSNNDNPVKNTNISEQWPRWKKEGSINSQEFKKQYGDLIERVKKAIDDLPKTLKSKYTKEEILDIIKDIYIFDKQELKIIPGEPIDKDKADKIKIIKAFENKLNLNFNETSDLIISAIEYIKKEADTSQEIKSARKEYVLKNVSKDQKTGKVALGQKDEEKRDISEVPRTSLHEDRVLAEMLIKIVAPEDIAKNLTTLWDNYIKSVDKVDQKQKFKTFITQYNIYTKALEKVLKVFYEKKPKLETDLEKTLFNNLRQITSNKETLDQLIATYKQTQPDEFYKEHLVAMAKEQNQEVDLSSTFILNDMFLKAYKYLEMKNNGDEKYLKDENYGIGQYQLKEFEEKNEDKKPGSVKPEPEPVKPELVKPEPEIVKPEPEPVKPELVKPTPEIVKPEPVKPDLVKPEPEPVKPELVNPTPEIVKPEPVKPELVKPEPEPVKPELVNPDSKPIKLNLKAAVIAYDQATVKAFSHDIADRQESRSYQDAKPIGFLQRVKNGAKRIWTHNLFRDYYRQKNIHQAEQDIIAQKNLFVDEDLTGTIQNNINHDLFNRLTSVDDINEAIQAGEKAQLLADTGIKERVTAIIKRYAFDGTLTDAEFIMEQNNIVQDIKQANPGIFDDTIIDANNLLEIATGLKAQYSHVKGIKNIELDIDIVIASLKAGARTEKRQTQVERLAEKMANTKLGKFVNETTLASALSICSGLINSFGSLFLYNKAAEIGSFGATALLSGTLGSIRKRNALEDQRRQFMRDQATSRNIDLNDKKVRDLERYKYHSLKAVDAIRNVQNLSAKFNDPTERAKLSNADITKAIDMLVEVTAHMDLSAEQSADLITYSSSHLLENERTKMVIANSQLKKQLKTIIVDRGMDLGGLSVDDYLKMAVRNKKDQLTNNPDGINMQNKRFASYKNKAGFKTFLHSAVTGLVIGATFQETIAAINPQQQGLVESWFGQIDKNPKSQTALKNLADFIGNRYAGGTGQLINQVEMFNADNRPGRIDLNNNQELRLDNQGNYDLYQNGKMAEENLIAFRNGKLVDNIQEWKDHGLLVESQTLNVGAQEQIKSLVSPKQFAEANPDMVSVAGKRVWIRNQTTGIYDRNELGINYGISNGGDPIIDISNMTRSGSFDFGKNIDVVNAVKDGKAYILGSISQDSAGRVFEIPLKGTKLIIDENSPLRQFFTINNGEVIFNGGAIEVAVKEGVTRNILATATGQNIINNIPIISKVPTILDQVTIHTIPEAIKDLPYRMPPFIPIRGEKPLPYKQADNKIVHQDDKTVIAAKGDGKKIVSKDDNIAGNQDNKNKVVTAPAPTLDVAGSKVVDDQGKNNIKPIKNNPKENKATPPIENKGGVKDQVKNVVSSSNQELITTIENRKKLFGWSASFELAKIAAQEGIDLESLTREEYAKYAIKNSLKINAEQLRAAGWERKLSSWEEYDQEKKRRVGQLYGSQADNEFNQFRKQIINIAKDNDPTKRVFKNNISVRSGTKKSSSWLFFKINNGMDQKINIVPKAYVTVKDISLLTPKVFTSIMEAIRDQKLNCDIKIFQKLADQGALLNDQIVIHGNTKADVIQALAIAKNILTNNFSQGDIGYDSLTQSYSEIIAQKIKTEVDSH